MREDVNIIRNADFSLGKHRPSGWVFQAATKGIEQQRGPVGETGGTTGVTVVSGRAAGTASWSQVVVCKPQEHYRVEATVTCDLAARDEQGGMVLEVQPIKDDKPVGRRLVTPGLHRVSHAIDVRAVYRVPAGVRRLRVSVGIARARGFATVHHVRFIKILEPEEESNILAIPPVPFALAPPLLADSACICSDSASDRPITHLLSGYLGEQRVRCALPAEFKPSAPGARAIFMPDPMPPCAVSSLRTLMKLAADRYVVISLPAFARLSSAMLSLRRIEQDDDPIHARIVHAGYATRGFALNDAFAYAWPGKALGSFVQNQYRKTPALKSFCAKHGLVTLLHSLCDKESTSDRPVCLHKPTAGGGLFVLDIEPAEAPSSTRGEPGLAMHLLLSILGHTLTGLGQYMVPARTESEFRAHIRDMGERFDQFVVHEADVPVEEATEQLVTVGRESQGPGRPLKSRPVILVRSGLASGDVAAVYGAFVWVKQLVRMEPFACPYVEELATLFRLAWLPCVAPWEANAGWRRSGRGARHPLTIEFDDSHVGTMIDVVCKPANWVRIVFPLDNADYRHCATWLPRLTEAFPPGRYFCPSVEEDEGFFDRERFAWRVMPPTAQTVVDASVFDDDVHRDVIASGGQVIRIEVPDSDADFVAHSMQRIDLVATLLEHVVGLQYGLIAVNRSPSKVRLERLSPVKPGQALIVRRDEPALRMIATQAG